MKHYIINNKLMNISINKNRKEVSYNKEYNQ
jgi:hypothetical protein